MTGPRTPRLHRSRKMDVCESAPVTPEKTVVKHPRRGLKMQVSDASHVADKGTPPGTPASQATTLVLGEVNDLPLTPSPKRMESPKPPGAPLRTIKELEVSKKNPPTPPPSDSESSEEESLGSLESLVAAADTDSDTDLSRHERLKQRKAALYLEWRDYYNYQKSFGENIDAECLEVYTHQGLINAGWVQDGAGRWNKPGTRAVTLKRPASAKPAPSQFVARFSKKGSQSKKKEAQKVKKNKAKKNTSLKVQKSIVKKKHANKASSSKRSKASSSKPSSSSKAKTKSKASSSGRKVKI